MSSSDSDEGAWLGGAWPSSLTIGDTEDLTRFGLMVPPATKVPGPWRIGTDGRPTLGPPPPTAQFRAFPGGRYNHRAHRGFWRGKDFDVVLGVFRDAAAGRPVGDITAEVGSSRRRHAAPAPAPRSPAEKPPPAPALVPIPPEQAALMQDGDPDDTLGLLAVLAQSVDEAALVAVRKAADREAALAAVQLQQAREEADL